MFVSTWKYNQIKKIKIDFIAFIKTKVEEYLALGIILLITFYFAGEYIYQVRQFIK